MTMDASNYQDNDIQAALHDGRLKQVQAKMAEMLEIIDNICQKDD